MPYSIFEKSTDKQIGKGQLIMAAYNVSQNDSTFDIYYDLEWHATHDVNYYQYITSRPIILGVVIMSMIAIGIAGNFVIISTAIKHTARINSALIVFFLNLCVASTVFMGFGMPLILYENVFMHNWTLGETFCKFHRYVQYCCFYGLAYAQVLIVLFQFLNIVIPHKMIYANTVTTGLCICCLKWGVVLMANIPNWVGHGLHNEMEGIIFCYHKEIYNDWNKLQSFTILHFVFSFALPFAVMCGVSLLLLVHLLCKISPGYYSNMTSGSKLQRRAASLTVLLTILFGICWTPDKIFALLLTFNPMMIRGLTVIIISDVFLCLACLDICLNPWCIYLIILRHEMGNDSQQQIAQNSQQQYGMDGNQNNETRPKGAQNETSDDISDPFKSETEEIWISGGTNDKSPIVMYNVTN